jgi:hypothetical protein
MHESPLNVWGLCLDALNQIWFGEAMNQQLLEAKVGLKPNGSLPCSIADVAEELPDTETFIVSLLKV